MGAVSAHSQQRTRVIANTYSNLWRGPLWALRVTGLRPNKPVRNWVAPRDLENLFELGGFEVLARRTEILVPMRPGAVSGAVNGAVARLPLLRMLALTNFFIARPLPRSRPDHGVSVIVPTRNEAGNIDAIVERVPEMGTGTEIVFVEGGSTDDTREKITAAISGSPRDARLLIQTETGKANAVYEGFAAAKHEVLMILDADLTVAPEDLPKFYDALVSGRGEMVVGSRLVYGMEAGAMRFLNMVGNKFFAWLLSFVLGQYVKDTLCGTKAMLREDYLRIAQTRREFEPEDRWGDFDFLLGASLLGMKVLNVPVRYAARTYGDTNMPRFSTGGQLARLAIAGFRRIWIRPVEGD
jgi:hypothetical protein